VAFTAVRLAAGALVLSPWLLRLPPGRSSPRAPAGSVRGVAAGATSRQRAGLLRGWLPALALVVYALPFSLGYVEVGAAAGALLLFGAVQLTMIGAGRRAGERLGGVGAAGLAAAFAGLLVLTLPGASAPALGAAATMLLAGVAWGAYSLLGRGVTDPIRATARAFTLALPAALVMSLWPGAWQGASWWGVGLAIASGALTSGLGYVTWYVVLPSLSRTVASVVQLLVPVVAALGAVLILAEPLDVRLVSAALLVLGGVAVVVWRAPPRS